MPRSPLFNKALPRIQSYFDNLKESGVFIFSLGELAAILDDIKKKITLPHSMTVRLFSALLEPYGLTIIKAPYKQYPIVRYLWKWNESSRDIYAYYKFTQSAFPDAHFSHFSALFLHGLTEQVPKQLFIRTDLDRSSDHSSALTQDGIHKAFARPARPTTFRFTIDDVEVIRLWCKKSPSTSVMKLRIPSSSFTVTTVERTLLDCMIRPGYAGGCSTVLDAFRSAQDTVTVTSLLRYLHDLNLLYPYHQVLGWYLDRSGFDPRQVAELDKLEKAFDFYADYALNNPIFDKRWRVYYPQELN